MIDKSKVRITWNEGTQKGLSECRATLHVTTSATVANTADKEAVEASVLRDLWNEIDIDHLVKVEIKPDGSMIASEDSKPVPKAKK